MTPTPEAILLVAPRRKARPSSRRQTQAKDECRQRCPTQSMGRGEFKVNQPRKFWLFAKAAIEMKPAKD